jgi:CRP/FNR family transcriptional regulator, cyclic AMP receptor protein
VDVTDITYKWRDAYYLPDAEFLTRFSGLLAYTVSLSSEAPVPLVAIDILRRVPLFESLSDADLNSFADFVRERSYPKGSVIVFEDDPGDALYVVASGQVKVVLVAEDGREVILSVLGPGSFFGEMAILDDEPRSAHVIAMEESNLLMLRREDFQARLRSMPDVAISLLKEISRRLRRADEKIGSLVLLDVHGRLAHLLLRMADEEQGDRITRKLTHHTIAQMIGSSRETVSRAMRNLVEQNVIEVTRTDIALKNRQALLAAARRDRTAAVPRTA